MTRPKFPTAAEAKKAGWFSRRHETDREHKETQLFWRENKGRAGRIKRARERE